MTSFLQSILVGIMIGSIYSVIAAGIVIVYKSTRVFNFAQGEFLLLGAYVCWMFLVSFELNMWLAFLLTLVCAVTFGLVLERFCFRFMIGEPVFALIMVTLGLSIMLRGVIVMGWGGYFQAFPSTLFPSKTLSFGDLVLSYPYLWAFIVALIVVIFLVVFIKYTKAGLRMRASAENQYVAQSLGVNVAGVGAMAWALCGVLAVIGGFFLGNITGISLNLSAFGLKALPVVLLGGLESLPGAVVAGLIVGILESLAAAYIDPIIGGGFSETFPFVILVIVLLFRPQGLFGQRTIERV